MLPVIRHFHDLDLHMDNPYGFTASFNPTLAEPGDPPTGWIAPDHVGINQGPIVLMLENHRTGFVWNLMRRSPYLVEGLRRAGFRGVPPSPGRPGQPPADLHRRRERSVEGDRPEAGEPDEGGAADHLERPEPPSVPVEVSGDPLDERVALGPGEPGGEVGHDLRVGVHGRERDPVAGSPGAQPEAGGADLDRGDHRPILPQP